MTVILRGVIDGLGFNPYYTGSNSKILWRGLWGGPDGGFNPYYTGSNSKMGTRFFLMALLNWFQSLLYWK